LLEVRDRVPVAAQRAQRGADVELRPADPLRVVERLEDRELLAKDVERGLELAEHASRRADRAQDAAHGRVVPDRFRFGSRALEPGQRLTGPSLEPRHVAEAFERTDPGLGVAGRLAHAQGEGVRVEGGRVAAGHVVNARGRGQLAAQPGSEDGAVRLQPSLARGRLRLGQEVGGRALSPSKSGPGGRRQEGKGR
jgi:hypothetical protein